MNIESFLSELPLTEQNIFKNIHQIIISADKSVTAVIEPMMGKEMIVYKAKGMMKYALASTKNHMSLHVLPIYGSQPLHSKYQSLLNKASFQKGCINFKSQDEMPLEIVKQLFMDCSTIDLQKIREEYLNQKKGQKNKKP